MQFQRFRIISCWLGLVILSLLDWCDANPVIHEDRYYQGGRNNYLVEDGNDLGLDEDLDVDGVEPLSEEEYRKQAFYVLKTLVKINEACFQRIMCEVGVYPKVHSNVGVEMVYMLTENFETDDEDVVGLKRSYLYGIKRKKISACSRRYSKCEHSFKELQELSRLYQ